MIYPSLTNTTDSRYTLVMAVAKRARQLVEGAPKLSNCRSDKPVTVAIHEISEGKITYIKPKRKE